MCQKHPLPALNRALVDFLRLVVVGLEEIRDEIDGQWEDDRRVLLRGYRVEGLQGATEGEREGVRRGQEGDLLTPLLPKGVERLLYFANRRVTCYRALTNSVKRTI